MNRQGRIDLEFVISFLMPVKAHLGTRTVIADCASGVHFFTAGRV